MHSPKFTDLSQPARQELMSTIGSTVETEFFADEHASGLPPGTRNYHAAFTLRIYQDGGGNANDRDRALLHELISLSGRPVNDESVTLTVGSGHFVMADLMEDGVWDALDAQEADLETLGSALFRPIPDGSDSLLVDGLTDLIEESERFAMLVNRVHIDEQWRGSRIGLIATGAVLDELRRGCSFAALYAMGYGEPDGTFDRRAAHEGLARYWSRLGFTPWRDDVMVLPFHTIALDTARERLRIHAVD